MIDLHNKTQAPLLAQMASSSELFLIRLPADADPAELLHDVQTTSSGPGGASVLVGGGRFALHECDTAEVSRMRAVLSTGQDGELRIAQPFARSFVLAEHVQGAAGRAAAGPESAAAAGASPAASATLAAKAQKRARAPSDESLTLQPKAAAGNVVAEAPKAKKKKAKSMGGDVGAAATERKANKKAKKRKSS